MDINNHKQRLSITSGKLNQLTDQQLDKIFEKAYYDNVIEVDISENNLIELSIDLIISIATVGKIQRLDLSGNQLTTLSGSVTWPSTLKELAVEGNPLISPPPEIIKQGTEAILRYLKKPIEQKELVRIFEKAAEMNVTVLDLTERKITTIPEEIGLLIQHG